MKKLITFLLVSFLVTTKLLATPYTIAEASGRTQQNFIDDIAAAKTAGYTDLIIQLDNGGTYGTSGAGLTIALPAGVTSLKFYAPSGTQPTFYTAGLVTFADAGTMTRITLDGVKFVCVGTSKSLILCSSTVYPLGFTIQNCYIQAFRYVMNGTNSTSCAATITNGVTINNNIFNGINQILAGFAATAVINSQTYTNNTLLETVTGAAIDYRTAINAGMNFTFSNNTIYSSAGTNFGAAGIIRLSANPTSGTYTISNNIIASGSAQTYASGNYRAYANLNFGTSYTTNNITYNATNAYYFTNIQSYTSGIATLAPNYATYDLTINDASFPGKSSCGDPRWYYPLTVTPSVTTLSGFSYNVGSGPSTSQPFTVSAVALRTAITLTAPIDYELSTDNISFSSSVSIGTAGSDMITATPVYVRLKAGLAYAAYNNELITIATTGMSNKTVSCSGNVLSGRTVLATPNGLSTSGITGGGFTASWNAVAHASSYTVNVYQGASTITSVNVMSGTTTDITTNLISGNTYTYKVMAIGDGSSYDNSPESSASASLRLSGSYVTDPFRTKASGSYSDLATWQSSPDGGTTWENATLIPDVNATSVSVLHDVTYAGSPATIGNVSVSLGVTLTNTTTAIAVAVGKTLTIASGATLDNQIDNATFSAGSGFVQVNGTYKVSAYTGGAQLAFSNVTFASGSTLFIGCPGAPRLPASNGGNVVWASAAGGSFLNTNPTTIAGNLTMTSALVNALNNGSGNTVRVLTISGNLTINGGVYNPQGGSGTGTQAVTVNGDVYLSGTGKLYAVNPLAAGLGTVDIKGNVYIQNPTDVALAAGGATGTITLSGTSQQLISTNLSTGYSIDGLTVSNTTGVLINSNLSASNLTTNASSILGLAAGKQLTANSSFTNNGVLNLLSDATGTATILTPSTIGGTGTTNVQQYLQAGRNSYISSPVTAAITTSLSSATSVVSYNEPTASWITESGSLVPMKGYISVNNSTSGAITFSGTLNNGDQTITPTRTTGQTKEGFNLVGNPYPSYVNWTAATKTNLLSTIWYRTKSASTYVFDTYNSTGSVATSNGLTTVSNLIPPMQAFWVRVDAGQTSGTLGFTNAMRSHADVSSNSFKAPASAKASQPLLRLQVSNGANADETVVYFNANASNGYDAYDSPKITNTNASIPEIYTTVATEHLVINGLNSIPYNQELPLGFTTGESNSFTIKTTEFSNFDANTKVYLRDKVLNKELELTDGTAYSFASDITTTTNQFAIVFKSTGVVTSLNNTDGNPAVLIYKNANNQIAVTCKGDISSDATVSVYNEVGQKLQMKQITSNSTVISTNFTSGVYMVTVNNAGKSNTQKVILD
jgi:hypothetical protein